MNGGDIVLELSNLKNPKPHGPERQQTTGKPLHASRRGVNQLIILTHDSKYSEFWLGF